MWRTKMELQDNLEKREKETNSFNWKSYNASQTQEKTIFLKLLDEICSVLETDLDKKEGRHCSNDSHRIFCMCLKIYLNTSARRLISDLKLCKGLGYLQHVSHFNTILNYFNDRTITKVLKYLIELSAAPLSQLERNFAVDATGIGTRRYIARWSQIKQDYGKHRYYKKLHVIFGTLTNVACSVIVTSGEKADSPYFQKLLKRTIDNFNVEEVSADLGYSSRENIKLCYTLDINPFIPFKKNTSGKARGCIAWKMAYDYFSKYQDDFYKRYHLRSNSETGFFMIKNKFGGFVRSRNEISMTNEILCKILCHNLTVLTQEIFLSKIQINFLEVSKKFVAQ